MVCRFSVPHCLLNVRYINFTWNCFLHDGLEISYLFGRLLFLDIYFFLSLLFFYYALEGSVTNKSYFKVTLTSLSTLMTTDLARLLFSLTAVLTRLVSSLLASTSELAMSRSGLPTFCPPDSLVTLSLPPPLVLWTTRRLEESTLLARSLVSSTKLPFLI